MKLVFANELRKMVKINEMAWTNYQSLKKMPRYVNWEGKFLKLVKGRE